MSISENSYLIQRWKVGLFQNWKVGLFSVYGKSTFRFTDFHLTQPTRPSSLPRPFNFKRKRRHVERGAIGSSVGWGGRGASARSPLIAFLGPSRRSQQSGPTGTTGKHNTVSLLGVA